MHPLSDGINKMLYIFLLLSSQNKLNSVAYLSKGDEMSTKIFVNLPIQDLDRSVAFFTKLGFSF